MTSAKTVSFYLLAARLDCVNPTLRVKDEVVNIDGIDPAIFDRIKDLIYVSGWAP